MVALLDPVVVAESTQRSVSSACVSLPILDGTTTTISLEKLAALYIYLYNNLGYEITWRRRLREVVMASGRGPRLPIV
jgi:hypothetical protein